ncbi:MAG: hypothetical protein O9302_15680 [Cyclobacteriaceae bacterium]|jgi:hypothetical protein|nr:hypothetical protein [Cytophagales bacterium]MCZ8329504.1 hypothetical protein [Cyclobacteriaceae bacterium]
MKVLAIFIISFIHCLDCSNCYSLYNVEFKNRYHKIEKGYFVINPDSDITLKFGEVKIDQGIKAYRKIEIIKDIYGNEVLICSKPIRLIDKIEVTKFQWIKDFYSYKYKGSVN